MLSGRELNLCLLSSLLNSLNSEFILGDIKALSGLELINKVVLKKMVEIFSSQLSVSVGGLDLEDSIGDLEDGDVEGTSSEIVHSDELSVCLVLSEGEGSGSGLVNDSLHIEVGNLTSILSGLSL